MAARRGDKFAGQASRHAVGTTRRPVQVQARRDAHGELGQVVADVAGIGDQRKWDHPGHHRDGEMILGRPPPVQRRLGHGGALGHLVHVQPRVPPGKQEIPGHVQHSLIDGAVPGAATAGCRALVRRRLLLIALSR